MNIYGHNLQRINIIPARPLSSFRNKLTPEHMKRVIKASSAITRAIKNHQIIIFKDPNFHKYTVKTGDSLQNIAKKEYGDERLWVCIYELNRSPKDPMLAHLLRFREKTIKNPDLIHTGQTLKIPNKDLINDLIKGKQPEIQEEHNMFFDNDIDIVSKALEAAGKKPAKSKG